MFRFSVRTVGLVLLAAGFAALIIDGTRSIAGSQLSVTGFGETALYFFPTSFPMLEPAIKQNIHPFLWDPFLRALFLTPTCIVLSVLGLLLIWLVRRRQVIVGYSSRP